MINGVSIRGSKVEDLDPEDLNRFLNTSDAYQERLGSHAYLTFWPLRAEEDVEKLRIPEGMVYVLGDNRKHSMDSRKLGFIPVGQLRGRAEQIWFSRDRTRGLRVARVGRVL